MFESDPQIWFAAPMIMDGAQMSQETSACLSVRDYIACMRLASSSNSVVGKNGVVFVVFVAPG